MKPYIRPRVQGVKKPEWYIEGLAKYISDVNEKYGTDYQIDMEKFDGQYCGRGREDHMRTD